MAEILRSSRAETDLIEIALYVARDNVTAANRLLDRLEEKINLLAEQPGIGQAQPDLGPELRTSSVGSYVIIYRPTADGIQLIRVVHGSRDFDKLF